MAVVEDGAQQVGRLPPFVALEPEKDRRLVGEILIERSDADTGLLGHPCGGEALRAFPGQNLSRSLQNRGDEVRRAALLGLFSRGNLGVSSFDHRGTPEMRIGNATN